MFLLETARLVLVTTPLRVIRRRLHEDSFTVDVVLGDTTVPITFPPEWPGEALPLLASELERRQRNPSAIPWGGTLIDCHDGVAVGTMGAKGHPDIHGDIEIGYGLNPAYHGRGYATEMAGALTAWLLARPNVHRVLAETRTDNVASIRVLEKNGFGRIGQREDEDEGPLYIWARRA